MRKTRPVLCPCRPRRCRRWPVSAYRTDRARGRPLLSLGQQTPLAGAEPPHGIRAGLAMPPSLALLRFNRWIGVNDTDKGKDGGAQSIFAARSDHCGKTLKRTALSVKAPPQRSPPFNLAEQARG